MKKFFGRAVARIKKILAAIAGFRPFCRRKKVAPVDAADYLQWVAETVAIPKGEAEPFCTAKEPPTTERQAELADNAAQLVGQLERLTQERCNNEPPIRPLLESVLFYMQRYKAGCALAAAERRLDFAAYRKLFTECLVSAVTDCTMLLSNVAERNEDCETVAAALRLIGEHLAFAGIHTAPLDRDACVDYGNYEVAYLLPTDDPQKKEHIAAIILPAYYLGESRLTYGSVACSD